MVFICLTCADAQADLSLRWAHAHFIGFVMSRLMYLFLFNNLTGV